MLNRIVRRKPWGWSYEPDQRHAELIIKELGLEKASAVKTPGEESKVTEELEEELRKEEATRFRVSRDGGQGELCSSG